MTGTLTTSGQDLGPQVEIKGWGRGTLVEAECTDSAGRVLRYTVRLDSGQVLRDVHYSEVAPVPVVGMGASIRLYTDTCACVITRVTRTQVTVRRVETGESYPAPAYDQGSFPVLGAHYRTT